jgi:hypothetical protein
MSVTRKTRIIQALTILYVVFFSLPMIFIWYSPMWKYTYYNYDPLSSLLRFIAIPFSSWAFLIMGLVCHKKGLKLRTYLATVLFVWAAQTQISLLLFTFMLENGVRYIRVPYF